LLFREGGELKGGGDEGHFELILVDIREGEGDAVEGDGALGDEVLGEGAGGLDAEAEFPGGGGLVEVLDKRMLVLRGGSRIVRE